MADKRYVVKEVKNAKLWSDGTITVSRVILSYPHVFEAQPSTLRNKKGELAKPSYSCEGLMPKATHEEAKNLIMDAIKKAIADSKWPKEKFPEKFIKDGDKKDDDGDPKYKPEKHGHYFITARESKRPTVRGPVKGEIWNKEDHEDRIYGGAIGSLLIRPWVQNKPGDEGGKRINANLLAVQFLRDGVPFGEGRLSDEDADQSFDDGDDAEVAADSGDDL